MAASNVPEGLKSITPYLQRAAQLQERDPVVSYYANYYAAKLAVPKAGQDAATRVFVVELLDTLEKQRKQIGENEAISSDLVGYAHIENFALKIFSKADDEDRAGQGSQKTAKNFVAAANFLELLKVFGDIDSEVEEKIKYSKWRAAEIVKAIRDGRQPAPPPGANKPKDELLSPTTTTTDVNMAGFESSLDADAAGIGAGISNNVNSTTYSPAVVAPAVLPAGQPAFPTISHFPSPPLGPTSTDGNAFNGSTSNVASSNTNSNWNQNQNQNQNLYNPTGTPSTSIPPAVSSPAPGPPSSGYLPTASNPTSPPTSNTQYGHGANSNINFNVNPYQAPVVPSPAPAQNPYAQPAPGFSSPSAPYQQTPSPQMPYAAVPIVVLDPAVNTQVQKHCKWTVSALTYDDIPTAIDNLEKALALLRPYHNKQ